MGTLIHDPFFTEMPAFFGMSFEDFLGAKHRNAWVEFELGQRTHTEFMQDFFADGRAIDVAAFSECVQNAYRWLPGMESVIKRLHESNVPMHVLSNYPSWHEWIEERLSISRFMPWSFVSCKTGVRKPEEDAFELVTEALASKPQDLILVDDRAINCRSALAFGIDAIHFENAEQLHEALRRRKIL